MKKILLLMLICFIKLSAYEYIILNNPNYTSYYIDEDGILCYKLYHKIDDKISINRSDSSFYNTLFNIKKSTGSTGSYITKNELVNFYKNDLQFLNDLLVQRRNPFFNFLYNENSFSYDNYIDYTDYEVLYNSDGLAIESIVNGVWAGLYDDHQKNLSGRLYSRTGQLLYINGKSVAHSSFLDIVFELMIVSVMECFGIASRAMVFVTLLAVVLVIAVMCACIVWVDSSMRGKSSPWIATFNKYGNRVGGWQRKRSPSNVHGQHDYAYFGFRTQRDYMQWNRERDAQIERKRRIF